MVPSPPHVISHPFVINGSGLPEKCPISHSSLSNRPEKVDFFFPFMISLLFPLRVAFPRIQNLNSWSPNWL
ncbi:hypothetical protein MTR67_034237 [Solanum verrucosum]|uniref:Uncharacterized protein n=1 Tax=Solanum verrucosum TaxID=315347 RepID=A0AAF0U7R7_SOLVR|nr:hypothetical protein MTR67_034237 [Solanum verrucosum]